MLMFIWLSLYRPTKDNINKNFVYSMVYRRKHYDLQYSIPKAYYRMNSIILLENNKFKELS